MSSAKKKQRQSAGDFARQASEQKGWTAYRKAEPDPWRQDLPPLEDYDTRPGSADRRRLPAIRANGRREAHRGHAGRGGRPGSEARRRHPRADPMTHDAYEAAAARAYAEGRREQKCPCGREEAGGSYCTACYRPMHPDDWTAAPRTPAQEASAAALRRAGPRQSLNEYQSATLARSAPCGPRRPSSHARRGPLRALSAAPATT